MLQAVSPALVLASASAARRALLSAAGLSFRVKAAAVDEGAVKASANTEGASAEDTAVLLASLKPSGWRGASRTRW